MIRLWTNDFDFTLLYIKVCNCIKKDNRFYIMKYDIYNAYFYFYDELYIGYAII